jgi:hypothetical protein
MLKLFLLAVVSVFLLSSCATLMSYTKKDLILVDSPPNLEVRNNNQLLEIKSRRAASVGSGDYNEIYMYSGVRVRLKSGLILDFKLGEKVVSVPVKYRMATGILVFETFLTFGVGTMVDLITGAAKMPKKRFIDVPALFNNTAPRSQQELRNYCIK